MEIEFTDTEIRELKYMLKKEIEYLKYEREECEDSPVLQFKNNILENIFNKIQL